MKIPVLFILGALTGLFASVDAFAGRPRLYCGSEELRQILGEEGAIEQFGGGRGYLDFADEYFYTKMHPCFVYVSRALTSGFPALGWHHFLGTTDEHRATRREFSDQKSCLVYKRPAGYIRYADDRYDSNMGLAFRNVSAVLGHREMAGLGWGKAYNRSTAEYVLERQRLTGDSAYSGTAGYEGYAEAFYGGQMQMAFTNASAALTEGEFARLRWGSVFPGTTKDRAGVRAFLFAAGMPGAVGRWYGKRDGLPRLAEDYLVSTGATPPFAKSIVYRVRYMFRAAVSEDELDALGWGSVRGAGRGCVEDLADPILPVRARAGVR